MLAPPPCACTLEMLTMLPCRPAAWRVGGGGVGGGGVGGDGGVSGGNGFESSPATAGCHPLSAPARALHLLVFEYFG